jgi:N-carbamoyl-L-amino-acid hydrolase
MSDTNLAIDSGRLWGELMETAAIGTTPKGGICRLTLTDLDRQVRDWFQARAQALGCRVRVDDMGIMFARREGRRSDLPPIAMGSHFDTQPTGGKFDGVLFVGDGLRVKPAGDGRVTGERADGLLGLHPRHSSGRYTVRRGH